MRDVLRRVRTRTEATGELDLVPVLSLVAVLVPLLLVTSKLGVLTALSAEPAVGGGERTPDLRVEIALDGFLVQGAEGVPGASGTMRCLPGPCPSSDRWPYDALSARLRAVKDARPDAHRLVLVAEPTVPYDVVVRTMDVAREAPGVNGTTRSLFPDVAVATDSEDR